MKPIFYLLLILQVALSQSEGADLQKISVSYVPNLAFTQLFVIKQEGWDKEAGLDFKPVRFPDASVGIQAFSHGDIDLLYTICPTLLAAVSKGIDAEVICGGTASQQEFYGCGELPLLAQKLPLPQAIHQLAQNRKKPLKFLAFFRGNGTDIQLRYWLSRQPEILSSDYQITNVAGQNQFLQAILAADYDAVILFEPLIEIAKDKIKDFQLLIRGKEMFPNFPSTVLAVSDQFAAKNKETIKKIIRLQLLATEFIKNNREKTAIDSEAFMTAGLIPLETTRIATINSVPYFNADPHLIINSTKSVYNFLIKDGLIQNPVDLSHFFNTSFYDEVVENKAPLSQN